MASWAALLALTGFHYSGVTGTIEFAPVTEATTWFWASGDSWGTVHLEPGSGGTSVVLKVLAGQLALRRVKLGDDWVELESPRRLGRDETVMVTVPTR
jgi:hypothetical protein